MNNPIPSEFRRGPPSLIDAVEPIPTGSKPHDMTDEHDIGDSLTLLARMAPMLRTLLLGDGLPARFNGVGFTERDALSTALAYDETDSLLYVSDFDDSMVHVVDPWADVHVRSFRVGHGPVALALRR